MSHYKNRRPEKFKGCCGMCACRDHVGGLRNKRALTLPERRARLEVREQVPCS